MSCGYACSARRRLLQRVFGELVQNHVLSFNAACGRGRVTSISARSKSVADDAAYRLLMSAPGAMRTYLHWSANPPSVRKPGTILAPAYGIRLRGRAGLMRRSGRGGDGEPRRHKATKSKAIFV